MKRKYIEELFGGYHTSPWVKETETQVDLLSSNGSSLVAEIPKNEAEALISDRNKLLDAYFFLFKEFEKHNPEAAANYWGKVLSGKQP